MARAWLWASAFSAISQTLISTSARGNQRISKSEYTGPLARR